MAQLESHMIQRRKGFFPPVPMESLWFLDLTANRLDALQSARAQTAPPSMQHVTSRSCQLGAMEI
jgi:hypothetical protein